VPEPFASMLEGGRRNSLGRAEDVVGIVLADPARLEELFASLADPDELVRMRAGDALEKVCRERPEWFAPHVERLLGEVGEIEQPSVQWHVAQMLQRLRSALSDEQRRRAAALLRRNLTRSTDWIVLNVTMDVLAEWAERDPQLARWLTGQLERLARDERRSVAQRASRHLAGLARRAAPAKPGGGP
jgi:hypothetical protein